MAHALGDVFAFRKLEGVGRGTIRVAASGGSIDDLLHSLTGEARFSVASGALVGIDLVEVMLTDREAALVHRLRAAQRTDVLRTGGGKFRR